MSITFDNEDLFASGPSHLKAGGQSLHSATEHPVNAKGVRLFSQGVTGRAMIQEGVLIADTPDELREQLDAIEVKLDGTPRTLVDHLEREWTNVVMLEVKPAEVAPLGPRWKVDYRIDYIQVDA